MKRSNWNTFKLVVFASTFNEIIIPFSFGKLRIVYFLLPVIFIFAFSKVLKNWHTTSSVIGKRFLFFIYFIYLAYGIITLSYSYYPRGTLNLFLQQLLSSFFFIYSASFFIVNPKLTYKAPAYFYNLLKLFSIISVINWGLAFVGLISIHQTELGFGILGKGRPGWFFGDANWLAYFSTFIYLIIFQLYKKGFFSLLQINKSIAWLLPILLFTQSRITLLLFILHSVLFYFKLKSKFLRTCITIGILFAVYVTVTGKSEIVLQFLPDRFALDTAESEVKNPRLVDAANLIYEINKHGRELKGFGWGALEFISDEYSYRNYSTTINFMPVQLYFDFGIIGCIFFSLIFLISVFSIKNNHSKFVLVFFIVSCCFHMPAYFTFSWILIGLYVFAANFNLNTLKYE